MKGGVRALGVAESYGLREGRSTLAGVVTRADRTVDGFALASCTVGGTDVTEAVERLWRRLDREDVSYLLVAGVALAWYNLLDLRRLHEAVERPVVAITFEESPGLEAAIEREFSGEALETRLEGYRALPPRRRLPVDGETLFVRGVGLAPDEVDEVVRAFTPEGGRPEPLRVARLLARAADAWGGADGAARPRS